MQGIETYWQCKLWNIMDSTGNKFIQFSSVCCKLNKVLLQTSWCLHLHQLMHRYYCSNPPKPVHHNCAQCTRHHTDSAFLLTGQAHQHVSLNMTADRIVNCITKKSANSKVIAHSPAQPHKNRRYDWYKMYPALDQPHLLFNAAVSAVNIKAPHHPYLAGWTQDLI
jgi:hypothetical protein